MQAAKLAAEDSAPGTGAIMPTDLRVTPVDASSLSRAPAAQAASVSGQAINASKFALPQANVMAVLRTAYYGSVQNFHQKPAAMTNPAPSTSGGAAAAASPGRDAAGPGRPAPTEGAQSREAKRLRVAGEAQSQQQDHRKEDQQAAGVSGAQGPVGLSAPALTASPAPSAPGAGGTGGNSSSSGSRSGGGGGGGGSSGGGRPSSGHSASRRGAAALKRLCAALGVVGNIGGWGVVSRLVAQQCAPSRALPVTRPPPD